MAGIYIHIPFCSSKCHYCNFYSSPSKQHIQAFSKALLKEIELKKDRLPKETIETVYLGGGTPSLLSIEAIQAIFEQLNRYFSLSADAEITMEANPESLTRTYILSLKNSPINRLSIGVQSFRDKDLRFLNRRHSAQAAFECIQEAQANGFENLNIDLIYGIPTATATDWEHNLHCIAQLNPPHLSAYALTQESGTAYDRMVKRQKAPAPSEEATLRDYHLLQTFLVQIKMEQYEISNYAKAGHHALHNSHYWLGKAYLGFGPSAHSFVGNTRFWNTADLNAYLQGIAQQQIIGGSEVLSLSDQWNELMLMPLRTKWGLDHDKVFAAHFPQKWKDAFTKQINIYQQRGWISLENKRYRITPKAKLMADGIAANLFAEEI